MLLSVNRSQVVGREGAEAMSVLLGVGNEQMHAQLDGFKSRALQASVASTPMQRHMYAVEWRPFCSEQAVGGAMLLLSDASSFVVPQARLISSVPTANLTAKTASRSRACHV